MNSIAEPTRDATGYDDEIDLMDLMQSLWNQRGLIVGITMACILGIGSIQLALYSVPTSQTVNLSVLFPFKGAEDGTYPDGSPFLLKDLTTNQNLLRAIDTAGLDISADELKQALTAAPGNELTTTLEGALQTLRSDSKTGPERLAMLDQTLAELTANANKTAELKLNTHQINLSTAQAERLLLAVLDSWAEVAGRDYGVSAAKIALPLQPFSWERDTDIAENIDALSRRLANLEQGIRSMRALPGIETTNDGANSIIDLSTRAELLRNAKIAPLRSFIYEYYALLAEDSVSIRIQRDGRIRTLELALDEKNRLLASYDQAFAALVQESPVMSASGDASLTNGPGVDGSFLGEMLKLGEQLGDQALKQTLHTKRISLLEDISTLREELALIQTNRALSFSKTEVNAYIDEQFPRAIAGINALRLDTLDLVAIISQRTLNESQALYQQLGQIEINEGRTFNSKLALQLALATVLGMMLGCLAALIRSAVLKRRID